MELERQSIESIVHAVADRLEGEWLLVGGALVALWLQPERTTEDVDLVGFRPSADARLELLELADELGLPVEALNTAADFFVERVAGWRDETEILYRGARGAIHRPSPTLFLLLKVRRLSERDMSDCLALIDKAASESLPLDCDRVVRSIDGLPPADYESVSERRADLRQRLASHA
ncbi:MAG: nucleotidyl transferase AbiEii/AbiGii toxin family protein [Planctomycetota bacterium]|jgi:hypothetical protein